MKKTGAPSEFQPVFINLEFIFNPTEKVINIVIVELDEFETFFLYKLWLKIWYKFLKTSEFLVLKSVYFF